MGRYAYHGQEVLKRDGKLVGFNAGYGFYSEHEHGYTGEEQIKSKKIIDKNKNHPFNGEIVENPQAINLMEFSDGSVWLTNDGWNYASLMRKTEEERHEIMDRYINNDDRKRNEEFMSKFGANMDSPEVIALWYAGFNGGGNFDLISTNEQSSELIRTLYAEMQRGNVAISSDYSFMFKDRGLSFVLLDQLTQEDLMNKQLVDHRDEMAGQFQKEYREYLQQEGLDESVCIGKGGKYPAEIWNVQISDLETNIKRRIVPKFYLEILDTSKGREDLDALCMHKLCRLTGDEIKALVPVVQSAEYAEYAKSHSQEEVETYLVEELALYRERQTIEDLRYLADKESLGKIASEQRTETVEKSSSSLKDKIGKWLHPDRENDKDKSEEKGE